MGQRTSLGCGSIPIFEHPSGPKLSGIDALRQSLGANLGFGAEGFRGEITEQIQRARGLMKLESKLEAARKRKALLLKTRENKSTLASHRRAETTNRALNRRWTEETNRREQSFLLRRQSEEHVMLRSVRSRTTK
jgi:hypothetical protein